MANSFGLGLLCQAGSVRGLQQGFGALQSAGQLADGMADLLRESAKSQAFARVPLPPSKTLGEKAPNLTLREELQAETDEWLKL